MASALPPWSDTALRIGLLVIALAIPGVFVAPMLYVRTPYNLQRQYPVDQPVAFDHRHHVLDDGIPCLYCHAGAERTPHAGFPTTELCMGCHAQIWNQSPMLEPVRRSYFSGQPLPWRRVHEVPDFVFFNHAVHVQGGVTCQECHGDVAQMAAVYKTELFTMGWCLDCHRSRGARSPAETTFTAAWLPRRAAEVDVGGAPERALAGGPLPPEGARRGVLHLENCSTCHR